MAQECVRNGDIKTNVKGASATSSTSVNSGDETNDSSIDLTFTASGSTSDFVDGDVTLTNCSIFCALNFGEPPSISEKLDVTNPKAKLRFLDF